MKITKNYPCSTRAENGDYILNGSLISEEGIEIELDDSLVVTGKIKAGGGIKAGCGIKAGTYIDCGKRIFAGTSVYDDENSCEKTIQCAELRNGSVAYGDLITTKQEVAHED